jgi:lipopolysaccharide transport system ATP-binding protein
VAAHLETEILIIDEVLAVGDTAFQKKCLGKMEDNAKEGRTVLFVSHDMSSVEALCTRGVLLKGGRIEIQGTTAEVVERYSLATTGVQKNLLTFPEDPHLRMQFLRAELVDSVDEQGREILRLVYEYVVRVEREDVLLAMEVKNAADVTVFYSNDELLEDRRKRQPGVHTVELSIPKYLLAPGAYSIIFGFWEPGRLPEHYPDERLTFRREEPLNRLSAHGIPWPGLLYLPTSWRYLEEDRTA